MTRRVLAVVSDESRMSDIRNVFDDPCHDVVLSEASSLRDARQMAEKERPDAILVAERLSDGEWTEIRRAAVPREIPPILVIVDPTHPLPVVAYVAAGASDVVPALPEILQTLPDRIQSVLSADPRVLSCARVSTGKLSALMDAVPDIIYQLDAVGNITFVNSAVRRYGYTPQELQGRHITTIVDPDYRDAAERLLAERRTGGRALHPVEIRLLAKNRDPVDFQVRSSSTFRGPILVVQAEGVYSGDAPSENTFMGTQGIARDVTAIREAQEVLTASSREWRAISDNLLVGLYRTTVEEGRIVDCNKRLAEMLGFDDVDEFKATYLFSRNYADPEVRDRLIERLRTQGEVDGYEARMYRKDGSTQWIRYSSRLSPDGTCLDGFVVDINAEKEAEEARRRSERQYALLFESMLNGLMILDIAYGPDGTPKQFICADANPSVREIFGDINGDLVGRDVAGHVCPASTQCMPFLKRVAQSGVPARQEIYLEPAGRRLEVSASMSDETRMALIFRDLTTEAQLEAQLRQAQKMEAVGQLAGGVAHDFNNLLQAIRGFADMALQDLDKNAASRSDLDEVIRAADRASRLVRQLLVFSRREMNRPEHLDVNSLVSNMTKMLRRVIGVDITLDVVRGSDLSRVYADPGQLEQVLMNLCVNARDAMPQGGQIRVTTANCRVGKEFCDQYPWAHEGDYVLMEVSDTGWGMTPEVCERVFEPFFTTKAPGSGTGLGLATVYGIVKQHEGMLLVDSEVGRGTTFSIYLPASEETVEHAEESSETPVTGGRETILLAEDEEVVRRLAVRVLERAGYRMIVARDGQEALDKFSSHAQEISLVLLDAIMPRVNGRVVFDRIRRERPELPVIFCSGYSLDLLDPEYLKGADARALQKPYASEQLLRSVRETLDAQASHATR